MSLIDPITLDSGRKLSLKHVTFSTTYEGLLMGLPSYALNQRIQRDLLDNVVKLAKSYAARPPTYIIPPVITTEPLGQTTYPCLPAVSCTGVFESEALKDGDASWAVIGWFQANMGVPTFTDVPWETLAADWYF